MPNGSVLIQSILVDPKGDVEKAGVNAEKQAAKPPMDEVGRKPCLVVNSP